MHTALSPLLPSIKKDAPAFSGLITRRGCGYTIVGLAAAGVAALIGFDQATRTGSDGHTLIQEKEGGPLRMEPAGRAFHLYEKPAKRIEFSVNFPKLMWPADSHNSKEIVFATRDGKPFAVSFNYICALQDADTILNVIRHYKLPLTLFEDWHVTEADLAAFRKRFKNMTGPFPRVDLDEAQIRNSNALNNTRKLILMTVAKQAEQKVRTYVKDHTLEALLKKNDKQRTNDVFVTGYTLSGKQFVPPLARELPPGVTLSVLPHEFYVDERPLNLKMRQFYYANGGRR